MHSIAPARFSLIAIVRDEVRSLLEWIAYHRMIGFDQIVIYDNESKDGTSDLCARLDTAGIIIHRPWSDPPLGSGIGPQVPAYQHAADHNNAEWMCFLDSDEFLVLEDYKSVSDLVHVAGRHSMPISLNWKIFGSNGERHYRDELVINRFTRCGTITEDVNRHIKTIGPKSAVDAGARVHIHGWILAEGQYYVDARGDKVEVEGCTFVTPPRWRAAWVNHYIVKSLEEFEKKCRRGRATSATDDPGKYHLNMDNYFNIYNCNQKDCQVILKGISDLRLCIAELSYASQRNNK